MRLTCSPAASGDRGRRGRVPLVHAAVVDVDVGLADDHRHRLGAGRAEADGVASSALATTTAAYGARLRDVIDAAAARARRGGSTGAGSVAERRRRCAGRLTARGDEAAAVPQRDVHRPVVTARLAELAACRRAGRRSTPGRR